ncbi:MAG TPA: IS4 family transposase, partial [Candidatus Binatia bacterium]
RLNLDLSLHEMLQILSVTPFEKTPLFQLLTQSATNGDINVDPNQLILL